MKRGNPFQKGITPWNKGLTIKDKRDKKQNKWLKQNGYFLVILNSEKVLKDNKEVEKIWQSI